MGLQTEDRPGGNNTLPLSLLLLPVLWATLYRFNASALKNQQQDKLWAEEDKYIVCQSVHV